MSCKSKWSGPAEPPPPPAPVIEPALETLLRASIEKRKREELPEGWTIGFPSSARGSTVAVAEKTPAAVLSPLPPPASISDIAEVLSPSQVNGYLDCSARWKYKYIDRLPEPSTGKQTRGKAVHALVGYYFRSRMAGYTPDAATLAEAYAEIWERESAEAVFSAKDDIGELMETGAILANKYIAEAGEKIKPVAIEKSVEGMIGGVRVRGFIDMLCQDASGKIIDLKVSGRTPSRVAHGHAMQLATYARLEPKCNGLVQLDTVVANKTPKLVSVEYQVPRADVLMTERLYPWVQSQMRMGAYAPNRNSMFCSRSNCAYVEQCIAEFGGIVE